MALRPEKPPADTLGRDAIALARLARDLPPRVAEAAQRYWDERGIDPHDWDAPLPDDFEVRDSW